MTVPTQHADELESTENEVERIIRTGTIWFAAAIVATTIALGSLLSSGWRPSRLPEPEAALFWIGAALAVASLAALAWAGCPVLGATLKDAARQKVMSIRGGVVLLIASTTFASLAVLLSPA